MQLINTDGMAFIGPGSEWLWTALTGLVLALTGFGIFRQLSAQRFGNELAHWRALNDEWTGDRMKRFRIKTLIECAQRTPDLSYAMLEVGGVFEELAYLQNHGLLESKMNLDLTSLTVQQYWWAMAAPRVVKEREDNPRLWREWERMAMRMAERDRRAGIADDRFRDPEYLYGPMLDRAIAGQLEGLRIEQEIRSGVLPTWPMPEPATEPTGAA
jgi:hypothetical protein